MSLTQQQVWTMYIAAAVCDCKLPCCKPVMRHISTSYRSSSTGTPFRGVTSLPVAIMMFFALIVLLPPSFRDTSTSLGLLIVPQPFRYSTYSRRPQPGLCHSCHAGAAPDVYTATATMPQLRPNRTLYSARQATPYHVYSTTEVVMALLISDKPT